MAPLSLICKMFKLFKFCIHVWMRYRVPVSRHQYLLMHLYVQGCGWPGWSAILPRLRVRVWRGAGGPGGQEGQGPLQGSQGQGTLRHLHRYRLSPFCCVKAKSWTGKFYSCKYFFVSESALSKIYKIWNCMEDADPDLEEGCGSGSLRLKNIDKTGSWSVDLAGKA